MTNYNSPGVKIEEVPAGSVPIVGVSTSTALFIGIVPDDVTPPSGGKLADALTAVLVTNFTEFANSFGDFYATSPSSTDGVVITNTTTTSAVDKSIIDTSPNPKAPTTVTKDGTTTKTDYASGVVTTTTTTSGYRCTTQNQLAHAVYGFFANGGTTCYVMRITASKDLWTALEASESIDDISIVAAPGVFSKDSSDNLNDDPTNTWDMISQHLLTMSTRFGILDTAQTYEDANGTPTYTTVFAKDTNLPTKSDATKATALYFPWLEVYDQAIDANVFVPPSGHMAGIYARVDNQRGVHKAPANESIVGVQGLMYSVTSREQDGLNPNGVNCLRYLNGGYTVWGARTRPEGSDVDFLYINVTRVFNYVRESLYTGTQWAVFEPNNSALWGKITRNITAFLTPLWQSGALFGDTADQAFYVKCDEELNSDTVQALGECIAEVGLAITKPAEFVVFRLGQK